METLIPLLVQIVSGAIGGNIVGTLVKKISLGTFGNSLAGIVGGGLGGQLLGAAGIGDAGGIIGEILSGGVGGGVLMIVIGLIKKTLAK